jgi:hypothetical protein
MRLWEEREITAGKTGKRRETWVRKQDAATADFEFHTGF